MQHFILQTLRSVYLVLDLYVTNFYNYSQQLLYPQRITIITIININQQQHRSDHPTKKSPFQPRSNIKHKNTLIPGGGALPGGGGALPGGGGGPLGGPGFFVLFIGGGAGFGFGAGAGGLLTLACTGKTKMDVPVYNYK